MFRKGKFKITLLIILACGFMLRLYVSSDHYLHEWDERYHALVAKNLIRHPLKPTLYDDPILPYSYKDWISNHVWLGKPPVPLWFIALSIYTFGNNEFAVRFPSLLLSLLAVYLTYLAGRYLIDEKTGLLAAFFHSVHGLLIELAGGRSFLVGVFTGLAILSGWFPALKVLTIWWIIPVIIFSFGETKRHTCLLLASPAFFIISS